MTPVEELKRDMRRFLFHWWPQAKEGAPQLTHLQLYASIVHRTNGVFDRGLFFNSWNTNDPGSMVIWHDWKLQEHIQQKAHRLFLPRLTVVRPGDFEAVEHRLTDGTGLYAVSVHEPSYHEIASGIDEHD